MIVAALLSFCTGLLAEGIRPKVVEIYAALETPQLRLAVDTSSIPLVQPGPEGAASWDVSRDGGPRPCGTEVLALTWRRSDGFPLRKDWLQAKVQRKEKVPVARDRLERGRTLDTTAVRWEWRETSGKSAPPPDSAKAFLYRVRTGATRDQILTASQLEHPAIVRAGDRVLVKSSRSGASASVEGIAQSDAPERGPVLVLTPWGRRIRCQAQADGTAISLE